MKALRYVVLACVVGSIHLASHGYSARVFASSVVPMDVETLADLSGQVILGHVQSLRSSWANHPERIETEIIFANVEYLKGAPPTASSTFTLRVPGGTVGQTRMQLCCAPTFAVGEEWLLFLLPSYKTHPVAGIAQGAFRITVDAQNVKRVFDDASRPVTGIVNHSIRIGQSDGPDIKARPLGGVNIRLRGSPVPSPMPLAITLAAFRERLAPILNRSRDHHLTEPAGKREVITYTPTPFHNSSATAGDSDKKNPSPGRGAPPRRGASPAEQVSENPGHHRRSAP